MDVGVDLLFVNCYRSFKERIWMFLGSLLINKEIV